ncbi:MAG: MarR family transcriptional regulator [Clostridia bacterium]|nr:MarR family transcriptional regulator [Clostridia bacterium]
MDLNQYLNEILVALFQNIMDIEEKALITEEFKDITINDMHVIEAVGVEEPRTMSTVAGTLSVTVGTLTTAINGLVNKGYVERLSSKKDRRVVLLTLTERGVKAYNHHMDFHDHMIQSILSELDQEERVVLSTTLLKLEKYLKEL